MSANVVFIDLTLNPSPKGEGHECKQPLENWDCGKAN